MTQLKRQKVCVVGLGFVGMAFSVGIANAIDAKGKPFYDVVGMDLPNEDGQAKIDAVNNGTFTLITSDTTLEAKFHQAVRQGNLTATHDPTAFVDADIIVVDIHLDVQEDRDEPYVDFTPFKAGIRNIGLHMNPEALVLVETTVPPGTCEKVVLPELAACFDERGLETDRINLAHSYERVMPGKEYYDSMVNFYRVYAGLNDRGADLAEAFLSSVINVRDYPLRRLHSMRASETAKVLENSYRATNIAFMEEWGRFAESIGVDIYQVVDAIRDRPTHNNIRQPGFGVGGYCLTKDPLFSGVGARQLFGVKGLDFPFCNAAVEANRAMPLVTVDKLATLLGDDLCGKRILLCGASYRPDVADTRFSPSQIFVEEAVKRGADVTVHDPMVGWWYEMEMEPEHALPAPDGYDGVVFAVAHEEYRKLNMTDWMNGSKAVIFDANCVLNAKQIADLQSGGVTFGSIGRGNI